MYVCVCVYVRVCVFIEDVYGHKRLYVVLNTKKKRFPGEYVHVP